VPAWHGMGTGTGTHMLIAGRHARASVCVLEPPPKQPGRALATPTTGHCSVAGLANEQMGGVAYLNFIRQLGNRTETAWPEVLAGLQAIRWVNASVRR